MSIFDSPILRDFLDDQTALLSLVIFAILMIGWRNLGSRTSRRSWIRPMRKPHAMVRATPLGSQGRQLGHDPAEQLREVMAAEFTKKRLMSRAEARVFKVAEAIVAELGLGWRVMAQVSLGEILASENRRAYSAINSKRVDILLVSRSGEPMAAIEYQGSGHHLGSGAARDAVKKEALRRAGVAYVEVLPDHDVPEHLRLEVSRISKQEALRTAA